MEETSNNGQQEELEQKGPSYENTQRQQYLDPEGGYSNPSLGLMAEKKAMMSTPPLHTNALPTKMYLDATVTPTVMAAL